jgi:hypothetical protein
MPRAVPYFILRGAPRVGALHPHVVVTQVAGQFGVKRRWQHGDLRGMCPTVDDAERGEHPRGVQYAVSEAATVAASITSADPGEPEWTDCRQ